MFENWRLRKSRRRKENDEEELSSTCIFTWIENIIENFNEGEASYSSWWIGGHNFALKLWLRHFIDELKTCILKRCMYFGFTGKRYIKPIEKMRSSNCSFTSQYQFPEYQILKNPNHFRTRRLEQIVIKLTKVSFFPINWDTAKFGLETWVGRACAHLISHNFFFNLRDLNSRLLLYERLKLNPCRHDKNLWG